MGDETRSEINGLLDKPIKEWPITLQSTYWGMPSWVRGDLQTVADLIELWIKNDRRALTEDEVFPNRKRMG